MFHAIIHRKAIPLAIASNQSALCDSSVVCDSGRFNGRRVQQLVGPRYGADVPHSLRYRFDSVGELCSGSGVLLAHNNSKQGSRLVLR